MGKFGATIVCVSTPVHLCFSWASVTKSIEGVCLLFGLRNEFYLYEVLVGYNGGAEVNKKVRQAFCYQLSRMGFEPTPVETEWHLKPPP